MNSMTKALAGMVLLAALGGINRSQASTVYTDANLKGCYGFLSSTVGQPSPLNASTVGTICFDGAGHILGKTGGGEDQTGWVQNTDGSVSSFADVTGTYVVTNSPGQGMGTFTFTSVGCGEYAFTLNEIKSSIAQGFQFTLVASSGCKQDTAPVASGWARIQP